MKNLRKLLAVVVVVAMMATFMIPAFAAESTLSNAEICETLGMLKGTGDGVTEEYLASATERNQAAIMFLRLQGLEDEALAYDGEDNFDDADEIWSGGQAILAYLKANPDLGWQGVGDNKFEPRVNIDAKSYYKVMLEALGYKQGEDFEWAEVLEFAAEKGLSAIADVEELTNDDIATATVEALKATVAAGDMTLIEKLVADEIVSEDAAIEAGLIEDTLAASVAATGAKKITVTFNRAADDTKATFAVKKGSFAVNVKEVTFAADKKSAVLELATKLTEGTYTVTVGGLGDELSGSVTVEDEKIAKIEFTSDKAPLTSNAKIIEAFYKAYNQYDEDITDTASGINATAGKGAATASAGKVTIDNTAAGGAEYTRDEKVALSLICADSGAFATVVLTVSDASAVAEINIVSLYNEDGEELTVNSTPAEFMLVVEAKDQYGNDVAAADIADDVLISVSNPVVAKVASTFLPKTIDDETKTTLALATADPDPNPDSFTAGTSTVRIISKTTGKMATFDLVVKEGTKVDTISLTAPAVAVADEDIEIPFTALDQFGNAITKASTLNAGVNSKAVTGTGTNAIFEQDYVKNTAKLVVKGVSTKGTYVLTIVTGTNKVYQLSFTAVEKAEPTVVAGIKDVTKVLAVGGTSDIDIDNIIVNDQYGREFDMTKTGILGTAASNYRINIETSAIGKVSVTGVNNIDDTNDVATLNGVTKGSSTITLKLQKGDGSADIPNSAYTFTAKVVEKADIESYKVSDFPKMYEVSGATHGVSVEVNGLLADGSKVAVPATYFGTSVSDTYVSYSGGELTGTVGYAWGDKAERTIPVVVTVYGDKGPEIFAKTLTVCKDAPEITTLTLAGGDKTTLESDGVISAEATFVNTGAAAIAADAIKVVDQYGIEMTAKWDGTDGKVYVSNYNKEAVDATRTIGTLIEGDYFSITAVANTGKAIAFKVIVK